MCNTVMFAAHTVLVCVLVHMCCAVHMALFKQHTGALTQSLLLRLQGVQKHVWWRRTTTANPAAHRGLASSSCVPIAHRSHPAYPGWRISLRPPPNTHSSNSSSSSGDGTWQQRCRDAEAHTLMHMMYYCMWRCQGTACITWSIIEVLLLVLGLCLHAACCLGHRQSLVCGGGGCGGGGERGAGCGQKGEGRGGVLGLRF